MVLFYVHVVKTVSDCSSLRYAYTHTYAQTQGLSVPQALQCMCLRRPGFVQNCQAARDAGVKQFVFVSVHDFKVPGFVKRVAYFEGKRRTEKLVGELFGSKGFILRPAFIYGEREVNLKGPNGRSRKLSLPLQRLGGPLARLTSLNVVKRIASSGLPLADVVWTQPLSAETVAQAAVCCCMGTVGSADEKKEGGMMDSEAVVLGVQDMATMA
ncbi:unnamed protein product [Choristocarpus tenellus]